VPPRESTQANDLHPGGYFGLDLWLLLAILVTIVVFPLPGFCCRCGGEAAGINL